MPELRNKTTGAVVSTSPTVAARLGSQWETVEDKPVEPKQAPAKRTRKPAAD